MSSLRILIASDEAIREFLSSMLRAEGCEVLAVASTGEAISQAAQFAPDTLIIETIMPGEVDGLPAAKLIAKETNCKVFFLETMHDYLSVSYCNALRQKIPDCDILPIPFEKDEVLAIVHRRVSGWSIAERRRSEADVKRMVSEERRNDPQVVPCDQPQVVPRGYKTTNGSWDWWAGAVFCVLLGLYIALVFYAPHHKTLTEENRATLEKARITVARVVDERLFKVKMEKDAKSHDLQALESDGQLLKGINAVTFGWTEEAAASTDLRIEPRGGRNLVIYVRKSDFETVLYPDRKAFVKAIGKSWCDNTGENSHWLLPSVYIGDIRTGDEFASYSCVFAVASLQ